ncbi:MAG: 1-deoxy-D-xylulose-5-phosphate synthase [Clostridia bacterium]|nr:1-deoxy-D-xylulose-5-phosphate synthase [Clostridia bacterium]
MNTEFSFLQNDNLLQDLKQYSLAEANALAKEIREFLVKTTAETGGHLASSLGVVELSIALHRVLSTPDDRIIFDVGHQAYVHKILTGRGKDFASLRKPGGLSGFTKRAESVHDAYGAGHSSTSVSAALGFATADKLCGRTAHTVAVVGDGAFTGGLVHEALNNIEKDLPLIIILNENEMSISKNIGGLARYISKIRSRRSYHKTKSITRTLLSHIPLIGKPLFRLARHIKKSIKNAMYGSNYFEDMGLYYLGPADGNNIEVVETLLREAVASGQSTVIHLKTVKGKGYPPAEEDPNRYHSVPPKGHVNRKNFSQALGETLLSLAENDPDIVAITAAMEDGCGLYPFAEAYPDRFFDVGIAEEHALIFAAGLSLGGKKPIVPIYSSFLQRAYDSILHDVALQHIPMVVPIDRASLATQDGTTHHGIYDVAFLSTIPEIRIFAPTTFASLAHYIKEGTSADTATFVRYPNAGELTDDSFARHGKTLLCQINREKTNEPDGYLLTYSHAVLEAKRAVGLLAEQGFSCALVVLEQLKPLPYSEILAILGTSQKPIVFLEEGIRTGGVGVTLYDGIRQAPTLANRSYTVLAIDSFGEGTQCESLYRTLGISAEDVVKAFLG